MVSGRKPNQRTTKHKLWDERTNVVTQLSMLSADIRKHIKDVHDADNQRQQADRERKILLHTQREAPTVVIEKHLGGVPALPVAPAPAAFPSAIYAPPASAHSAASTLSERAIADMNAEQRPDVYPPLDDEVRSSLSDNSMRVSESASVASTKISVVPTHRINLPALPEYKMIDVMFPPRARPSPATITDDVAPGLNRDIPPERDSGGSGSTNAGGQP